MATTPLHDPHLRDVPTVDGYKVLEPAVLVEKLPEGGMAAVYRGLHLDLKVDVAVKVLKRGGDAQYSPQAVARFRQEAEQAARLNDENLVRIYDFPANRLGLLYIVMEYVDGETLEDRVRRKGRLAPREAMTIALRSADGLLTAHHEGVIHRDVKPPNILISKRGRVKVTDLGIAKAQDSAAMGMTQEITLLGTPQYMAPELWRGARFASAASDVFAVGATLAFMLAGRHLLDGTDTNEIMHQALTSGFPDLAQAAPDVPPELAELVRRCTAARLADRPTLEAVIDRLRELLAPHGGEVPLADPQAGANLAPLTPTRFPTRADLDTIRQRLHDGEDDEGRIIPRTLRVADDPKNVSVAMQAFLGGPDSDVSGASVAAVPPATAVPPAPRPPAPAARPPVTPPAGPAAPPRAAPVRAVPPAARPGPYGEASSLPRLPPAAPPRRRGGAGKVVAALLVLGGLGAGGYVAYHEGLFNDLIAGVVGPGPTPPATQPTTRPAVPPTSRPDGPPGSAGTRPAAPTAATTPRAAAVDPPATATRPVAQPPASQAVVGPAGSRPVAPPPRDPPVVAPAGYAKARQAVTDAVRSRRWKDALAGLSDAGRLARAEGQKPDFVATADAALTAFRAEQANLGFRRVGYPELPAQVAGAAEDGSGAAALALAEHSLEYAETAAASRRLSSVDPAGFGSAIKYLEMARASKLPAVASVAAGYLVEARVRQAEYLGNKRDWPALVDWLGQVPVAALAGSADAGDRQWAGWAVEVADEQLARLRSDVEDLPDRQRIARDRTAGLSAFADAGSANAALLLAEGLIDFAGEGADRRMVSRDAAGSFDRIVELAGRAGRAAKDPAVAATAAGYLFDAAVGGVRAAAERRAWGPAVAALAGGQPLAAADAVPAERKKAWRDLAERTLMALRADVPDLDKRREAFPELTAQLQPLADGKVYAALLAQAERYIGYDGGDPPRAVGRAGDPDFRLTRDLLSKVVDPRVTDCPPDVRAAALGREWDVYAAFARQEAGRPPERVLDKLKLLAQCAANDAREADYGKLVDELLPADDARYPVARTELAEHRMNVVENEFGYRSVGQKKPTVIDGVRRVLVATRDSADPKARARANALLGELAMASPGRTPESRAEAFGFFRAGANAGPAGDPADPVALMGLALFWQLTDQELKSPEYANPVFEELRRMTERARTVKTLAMYRDAARSGDTYANFLAGHFMFLALRPTPENRREIERYLNAAIEKKHKRAETYLKMVQSQGGGPG